MIVVEGFDTSGKSTLAQAIAAAAKVEVYHTGGPTTSPSDVLTCLSRSEGRLYERCVQDRVTHVSESVYSMLTAPTKAALALSRIDQLRNAKLVIYCRPPREVLMESVMAHVDKAHDPKGFTGFVKANAGHLITIYDTVMSMVSDLSGINFFLYDRTLDSAHECVMRQAMRVLK